MNQPVNHDLSELTDAVVASYQAHPDTQRIDEVFLPSRSRIVELLDELRMLLFPGFFGRKRLTQENIRFHVGNLLVRVADGLAEQIRHCMCTERGCTVCEDPQPCQREAEQTTRTFLGRLPALRESLALDAQAALDGDPAAVSIDEIIYCYPGFYAVTVYRIAHELLGLGVPLMPRMMTEHAHSRTGCDLHPGAMIGKRFFIDHATGVIIGETTVIGDNVKIYQGVTLGGISFQRGVKRHPTLEDDVTVYANATILGGETVIGRGVTVNGNVFVTRSIEADSTVTPKHPELKVRAKRAK
jgi:serine O-acetyltransferase